jgi:hypothetical protein
MGNDKHNSERGMSGKKCRQYGEKANSNGVNSTKRKGMQERTPWVMLSSSKPEHVYEDAYESEGCAEEPGETCLSPCHRSLSDSSETGLSNSTMEFDSVLGELSQFF